ncbi:MAG: PAS domain-containing sensor histidine kinase [Candidatus Zixiibacteriota bacterium]
MPSFAKKLFRLFLLFSLVPSVLLALAGYYLAVETSSLRVGESKLPAKEFTDYYNNLLFTQLERLLEKHLADSQAAAHLLDFLFTMQAGRITWHCGHGLLSQDGAKAVARSATNRTRGFIEHNGTIYQFSCRKLPGDGLLCGGVKHEDEYATLLTSLQTGYASRTSEEQLRPRYLYFLALIFVALSLGTIGFAYLFSARLSRSLTQPLTELSKASKEIAAGNFNLTVPVSGTGEIQTLIANFNRMAHQLDKTTARLAQSERVAAWRHLARRFAHELKNPLQPILVSLYRIEKSLEGSAGYEQIMEHLRAASEEIKHLTALADRFSDLAKLPPPKLEKTNMNELLASFANLYRQQLSAYDFALLLPTHEVYTNVDVTYFREALHNILLNSIDASEEGSRIVVELKPGEDTVQVIVQDSGRGMSESTVSSARMPYFTTKEKGSGLGLAIVEKTVNELGGQLIISSKEGIGTTVTISLPRAG